jgi:hypothetical protein
MMPSHVYYQLAIVGLLWLCIMLHYVWPGQGVVSPQPSAEPVPPQRKRKRASEPTPFAGLTQRPHCAVCEGDAAHPQPLPPRRPAPMPATNRRPRVLDPSGPCCPHDSCDDRGWLGLGHLRAHGHPSGGPWRQFYGTACAGYFLETHGTLFHGKRVAVERIVHVLACLAEGLGLRGTARGGVAVDPNTVLGWLVEAADRLQALSRYCLHDIHIGQGQLAELDAVLRAVKDGTVSEAEAIERLARSPQWVWAALDPESTWLLAIDVGHRTLAMAQRVVHQVVQGLAPGGLPLLLTDGLQEDTTALLTH